MSPRGARRAAGRVATRGLVGLCALCALGALACGGGDADEQSGDGDGSPSTTSFTPTDSAGVTLLVTVPADSAPAAGWTVSPEPAVEFTDADGEPFPFYRIAGARRLSDGTIVVLAGRELLYFAASGALLARAAGEGDGPGELGAPSGPAVLGGDTVLVFDGATRRFNLYDAAGGFLEGRPLEPIDGASPNRSIMYHLADAGEHVVTLTAYLFRVSAHASAPDTTLTHPNLRFSTAGAYLGEAGEPSMLKLFATSSGQTTKQFSAQQAAHVQGARVYVRDPGAYEVREYDAGGELARIYRLMKPRRPTTDEDVERFVEFRAPQIEDAERRRRFAERAPNRIRADSFPSISDLRVDALGGIWVTEYRPAWEGDPPTAVFGPDGRWLGTVATPPGFEPLDIGKDYMLGVRTDELDVQHLQMYRLER